MVAGQRKEGNKWVKYRVTFYDPDYPLKGAKTFFFGCAGFSSTANDYTTFLKMCLSKGELKGVRLLSRTTVNSIMSNQFEV
ncbi:hypothetical protein ACFQZJ_01975 [Maribacter chungangensis]|uniref:Uncharacterized protein n=1 Tax=Maribacter chungangensis TaxID=1069117 RepID=A0ABW3B0C8_9FLAO